MPLPPSIAVALAGQHRRDLLSQAETCRLARAARSRRPAPGALAADPARITQQLTSATRRAAIRPRLLRVPAAPLHPQCAARFAGDLSPDPAHAGSAVSPGSAQAV